MHTSIMEPLIFLRTGIKVHTRLKIDIETMVVLGIKQQKKKLIRSILSRYESTNIEKYDVQM